MSDLKPEQTNLEQNLDNKLDNKTEVKESFGSSIRNAFGLKDKTKETKTPEKKPEEKPVEKPEEAKPAEKEPEYDEILYNKEKVKIPVTERQTYLQKGYNYDKVKQTADNASATLQRIAKVEGFKTVDEYLVELSNREKANIAEKIQEADGDPEKIDEIVSKHPKVLETLEKEKKQALKEEIDVLKQDRFFKDLEADFNSTMADNPTVAPTLLYKLVRSDYLTPAKLDEISKSDKASAEKKAIADMHDSAKRSAPTGGDAGDGKDLIQPTDFGSKIGNIFGLDKNHIQKAAQRTHEKLKRS